MIERENNGATLSKVEVNANGGTLSIKSGHVDSLVLAVEQAGNTGWNRVIGAQAYLGTEMSVTLTLSKAENGSINLPTLRGAIRRKDLEAILSCNSEELVSYSENEYVPEAVNDIPPPELIQEEGSVGEEAKPSLEEKSVKKASKKKTTEEQ